VHHGYTFQGTRKMSTFALKLLRRDPQPQPVAIRQAAVGD
jgi:hypothetical protein